jgi:hypothetical protein
MGETRATLSVVTSRVRRIVIGHAEAAELDAGFDGGEFLAEVEARTTVKWAFFCGLFSTVDALAGDELDAEQRLSGVDL